jgi:hypothetical protein
VAQSSKTPQLGGAAPTVEKFVSLILLLQKNLGKLQDDMGMMNGKISRLLLGAKGSEEVSKDVARKLKMETEEIARIERSVSFGLIAAKSLFRELDQQREDLGVLVTSPAFPALAEAYGVLMQSIYKFLEMQKAFKAFSMGQKKLEEKKGIIGRVKGWLRGVARSLGFKLSSDRGKKRISVPMLTPPVLGEMTPKLAGTYGNLMGQVFPATGLPADPLKQVVVPVAEWRQGKLVQTGFVILTAAALGAAALGVAPLVVGAGAALGVGAALNAVGWFGKNDKKGAQPVLPKLTGDKGGKGS